MIKKLTPEQEDLIRVYEDKWWEIMYSTEPIDREKAAEAVKEAYLAVDEKEPEVIFCDSPYEAANLLMSCDSLTQLYEKFGVNLYELFEDKIYEEAYENIKEQLSDRLFYDFFMETWNDFYDVFRKLLEESIVMKIFLYWGLLCSKFYKVDWIWGKLWLLFFRIKVQTQSHEMASA